MAAAGWRQPRLWGMEKAAMEYQIRQQADSVGRGEDIPTRASLAFATLGDSSALDLIIRYDAPCDRQYLRVHRRYLETRRQRGESSELAKPQPEVAPQPEALEGLTWQPARDPLSRSHLNKRTKNNQTNPTTHCKQSNPVTRTRCNPGKRMKSAVILTSGF
jgi:hypothetical protein